MQADQSVPTGLLSVQGVDKSIAVIIKQITEMFVKKTRKKTGPVPGLKAKMWLHLCQDTTAQSSNKSSLIDKIGHLSLLSKQPMIQQ